MVLESKNKGNVLTLSFNDEKTKNSISANDWIEFRKQVKEFDESDLKYLVLSQSNGNFSSGAQLGENLYKMVEPSNLQDEASSLIEKLDKLSFISICMNKEQIKNGLNKTFSDSLELEGINQKSRFIHSDAAEGMLAFMDKRQPDYKNTLDV